MNFSKYKTIINYLYNYVLKKFPSAARLKNSQTKQVHTMQALHLAKNKASIVLFVFLAKNKIDFILFEEFLLPKKYGEGN